LFDCGEGTQRQMIKAGISFHKVSKILVTHMHGDHITGLPGLLQTMSLLNRKKEIEIYGPPGISAFIGTIEQTVKSFTFPASIHEIQLEGIICREKNFRIEAVWSNHGIPSLAYGCFESEKAGRFHPEKAETLMVPKGPLWSKLQQGTSIKLSNGRIVEPEEVVDSPRPGNRIIYTGDTRPSRIIANFAQEADLLIHEATLHDDLIELAQEKGHSTPIQAAEIAKEARVKSLILTHISARYKSPERLLLKAREVFSNVSIAEDLMVIIISAK